MSASRSVAVELARSHAITAHRDQLYGGRPYVVHLDAVHDVLVETGYGSNEPALVAAYLHDILEDTAVTWFEIEKYFGRAIADIVLFCTDPPGKTRKERKAKACSRWRARLDSRGHEALDTHVAVKVADRIANVRASDGRRLKMYRKEAKAFHDALAPHRLLAVLEREY